jgi:NADH-quinone oxidoreductase subunit F
VFEREAQPGGMLTAAIPAYRLPREVLQKEIAALLNHHMELRCGMSLGRDFTVDTLFGDGFKAVFIATGAHRSKTLGLPGEESAGILPGIEFLKAYNLEHKFLAKGRVGVIGGGNSAIDAARSALRQPGVEGVTVYYRRTRQEMPAYRHEIETGVEEGIRIEQLVTPVAVLREEGRLTGMRFIRNKLGGRDASGRQKPVAVPGTEFDVKLDTLIVAISEDPESPGGIGLTASGTVAVSPESLATDRPGVFAGGDVVTGPNTVIAAIATGKRAALMMDRYVTGRIMKILPKVKLPSVYVEPVPGAEDEDTGTVRLEVPLRPVAARKTSFVEVEMCPSERDALAEARRCLRCDLDFTQPH